MIRRRTVSRTRTPDPSVQTVAAPLSWEYGINFQPRPSQFVQPLHKFHPNFRATSETTPFQLLRKFIDESMVDKICAESNDYSSLIKTKFPRALKKWTPLNESDFWKFMALSTLMGVVKKADLKEYWSTNELLQTPIFGKTMSRDRCAFQQSSLHVIITS